VTFGGADPGNLAGALLRQLVAANLPDGIAVDVILGTAFPRCAEIDKAAALPAPTAVSTAVGDRYMLATIFAIN